ncbi:MAG: FtsQ-type POTRA domain-containing protein [Syntrophales bacterium]|nr:FtsQ-type POTRA domain-containing protein [Syntrophales bacterium]
MKFFRRKKAKSYRTAAAKYRLQRKSGTILRDVVVSFLSLASIVVITASMIYAYSFVISMPYFNVQEITIRGCKELTEKDVLSLAAINPARNILVVDADEIGRRIRTNPWIKDVSVGREFPNRVVIEIRERTPVALLKKDTAFFLMDIEGVTFKRLEMGDEMDLPVLTGFHSAGKTDSKLLDMSLSLLQCLAKSQEFPNIKTVSEIHGNERLGISLFTNTGLCLFLGFDNYENKFKRLPPVMADLDRRSYKTSFLQIDLSDPVKVTVQQKNIMVPSGAAPAKARLKT